MQSLTHKAGSLAMKYDILFLFYFIDEFCKIYEKWESAALIGNTVTRCLTLNYDILLNNSIERV